MALASAQKTISKKIYKWTMGQGGHNNATAVIDKTILISLLLFYKRHEDIPQGKMLNPNL